MELVASQPWERLKRRAPPAGNQIPQIPCGLQWPGVPSLTSPDIWGRTVLLFIDLVFNNSK